MKLAKILTFFVIFIFSLSYSCNESKPSNQKNLETLYKGKIEEAATHYTLTTTWSDSLENFGKKLAKEKAFRKIFHDEWKNIPHISKHGFKLQSSNFNQDKLSFTITSYKSGLRSNNAYDNQAFSSYLKQTTSGANSDNNNRSCLVGEGFRSFWSRENGTYLLIPTYPVKDLIDFSNTKFDNEIDNFWKEVGENIILFKSQKAQGYLAGQKSSRNNISIGTHTGSIHGQTVFHFHFRLQNP